MRVPAIFYFALICPVLTVAERFVEEPRLGRVSMQKSSNFVGVKVSGPVSGQGSRRIPA